MSDVPRPSGRIEGAEDDPLFDPELDVAPQPRVDLSKRPDLLEAIAVMAEPFDRGPSVESEAKVHVGPTEVRPARQKTIETETVRVAERVDPRRVVTQRIEPRREPEAALEVPGSSPAGSGAAPPRRRPLAIAGIGAVALAIGIVAVQPWRSGVRRGEGEIEGSLAGEDTASALIAVGPPAATPGVEPSPIPAETAAEMAPSVPPINSSRQNEKKTNETVMTPSARPLAPKPAPAPAGAGPHDSVVPKPPPAPEEAPAAAAPAPASPPPASTFKKSWF